MSLAIIMSLGVWKPLRTQCGEWWVMRWIVDGRHRFEENPSTPNKKMCGKSASEPSRKEDPLYNRQLPVIKTKGKKQSI